MKITLTLAFSFILSFNGNAQTDNLYNSLESLLKTSKNREVLNEIERYLGKNEVSDSVFAKLYNFRARAFERMGNYDSVFYTYQSILLKKPDDLISLIYLGSAYGDGGYYKEMAQIFYQLKRYYPTEHVWATNMSYYLNEGGYYELRKNYADTSLLLAKDSTWIGVAFNNRAYANLGLGNLDQAKNDIQRSFSFFPNNSYAYRNNALIFLSEGDTTNACQSLFKAKELGGVILTEKLINENCKE